MKIQIRRGVFETNSSSMHSLVIMKNGRHYTEEELNNPYRHIEEDGGWEFAWPSSDDISFGRRPFDMLVTFEDKLRYVVASMVNNEGDDVIRELNEICRKYIHGSYYKDGERRDVKFSYLVFPTRPAPIYEDDDGNEYDLYDDFVRYVDHKDGHAIYETKDGKPLHETGYVTDVPDYGYSESSLVPTLLKRYGITLEEFMLNNKYIVIIDGDEHDDFGRICHSNIINVDGIEAIISQDGGWGFDNNRLKQKVINKECL